MTVYYIEEIIGEDGWGSRTYRKISPIFDSNKKAEDWAKEHKINIHDQSYPDYLLREAIVQ